MGQRRRAAGAAMAEDVCVSCGGGELERSVQARLCAFGLGCRNGGRAVGNPSRRFLPSKAVGLGRLMTTMKIS